MTTTLTLNDLPAADQRGVMACLTRFLDEPDQIEIEVNESRYCDCPEHDFAADIVVIKVSLLKADRTATREGQP